MGRGWGQAAVAWVQRAVLLLLLPCVCAAPPTRSQPHHANAQCRAECVATTQPPCLPLLRSYPPCNLWPHKSAHAGARFPHPAGSPPPLQIPEAQPDVRRRVSGGSAEGPEAQLALPRVTPPPDIRKWLSFPGGSREGSVEGWGGQPPDAWPNPPRTPPRIPPRGLQRETHALIINT